MAQAARTAPKSRSAAFCNLGHQARGVADMSGRDRGAGDGRKTESQRDTQKDRSHHPVFLPAYMKLAAPVIELIHGTLGNNFLVEGGKASIPQRREACCQANFS
jgi:hypothetical protein